MKSRKQLIATVTLGQVTIIPLQFARTRMVSDFPWQLFIKSFKLQRVFSNIAANASVYTHKVMEMHCPAFDANVHPLWKARSPGEKQN